MSVSPAGPISANLADRLSQHARERPQQLAIIAPPRKSWRGEQPGGQLTFQQLDQQVTAVAAGLQQLGAGPGQRLVLFIPFSIDFVIYTFAILRAGATIVLIDPGMGRSNIFRCLQEVEPDGFIAIPRVHWIRWWFRRRFPNARLNVSVGGWGPDTRTDDRRLRTTPADFRPVETPPDHPAAIIFTSGSTGPPKGVHYEHGMFNAQVELIQQFYGIEPGEVDLPGFPLFGLFNAAMGVTTVIPEMDPTRPARVAPRKIVSAIEQCHVTQAFGSPAFWNRVGRYCEAEQITFPRIRRALSAGGPVPVHVLRRMTKVLTGPQADLFTPYGATESLPVASIGAREVLSRTAAWTARGAGTCVGRVFPGVEVRIIPLTEGPIERLGSLEQHPPGTIGEIIVRSPAVTREYYRRAEATRLAKIPDGDSIWHRIGDVGYLDQQGLLWFCGRKAHIVETAPGTGALAELHWQLPEGEHRLRFPLGKLFSVCCEGIYDEHPRVYRTALVGIGPAPRQQPVLIVEPEPGEFPSTAAARQGLAAEILAMAPASPLTAGIARVLFHPSLPVDTRHNVKINREALTGWAASQLK